MKIENITESTERGARPYQEDRSFVSHNAYGTLLAVFDGHGGDEASEYCEFRFAAEFINQMSTGSIKRNPEEALRATVAIMAAMLRPYDCGTTASIVFIPEGENVAYTAVLGDSPIIIGSRETGYWFGPDHNVRSNPEEATAAQERGGFIHNGYLLAHFSGPGLQMARALGDSFMGRVLNTEPEMNKIRLDGAKFILVATDGVFDPSHHSTKAYATVIDKIEQGEPAEGLTKYAVELPTGDNATAILVRLA